MCGDERRAPFSCSLHGVVTLPTGREGVGAHQLAR